MNSKAIRSCIRVFTIIAMFLALLPVTVMPVHAEGTIVNIEIGSDGNAVGGSNTGTGYTVNGYGTYASIEITQNITLIISNPHSIPITFMKSNAYTSHITANTIYAVGSEYAGGDTDSNSFTEIFRSGTISGGTFSGTVDSYGTISGGIFAYQPLGYMGAQYTLNLGNAKVTGATMTTAHVIPGTTVSVTADADPATNDLKWSATGATLSSDTAGTVTFTMPSSDVTCSVTSTPKPSITGETAKTLGYGYATTATDPYTVVGTVTKSSGDDKITWDDTNKTLNIAAGLAVGTYDVVLKASNGITTSDKTLTFTLTVNKVDQSLDTTDFKDVTKTYGDADFSQTVTVTKGEGTVSYSSDAPDVATVDSTGKVTITGVGTATITATASSTEHCNAATASYKLTVGIKTVNVLEGDKQTITKGKAPAGGIAMRFDADVAGVTKVSVNGTQLTKDVDYVQRTGSMIINLKKSYLDTLAVGTYTLRVDYGNSMYGESTFTVKPAVDTYVVPDTGDKTPSAAGWGIVFLASIGMAVMCIRRKHQLN